MAEQEDIDCPIILVLICYLSIILNIPKNVDSPNPNLFSFFFSSSSTKIGILYKQSINTQNKGQTRNQHLCSYQRSFHSPTDQPRSWLRLKVPSEGNKITIEQVVLILFQKVIVSFKISFKSSFEKGNKREQIKDQPPRQVKIY